MRRKFANSPSHSSVPLSCCGDNIEVERRVAHRHIRLVPLLANGEGVALVLEIVICQGCSGLSAADAPTEDAAIFSSC